MYELCIFCSTYYLNTQSRIDRNIKFINGNLVSIFHEERFYSPTQSIKTKKMTSNQTKMLDSFATFITIKEKKMSTTKCKQTPATFQFVPTINCMCWLVSESESQYVKQSRTCFILINWQCTFVWIVLITDPAVNVFRDAIFLTLFFFFFRYLL